MRPVRVGEKVWDALIDNFKTGRLEGFLRARVDAGILRSDEVNRMWRRVMLASRAGGVGRRRNPHEFRSLWQM